MTSPPVFDRAAVRRNRARAAPAPAEHRFLFDWTMENLLDRLGLVRRQFPRVLQLGGRPLVRWTEALREAAGADFTVVADSSPPPRRWGFSKTTGNAHSAPCRTPASAGMTEGGIHDIAVDEENLPFAPHSFDLAVSPLTLHSVNDLPGALIQLRRTLRPDGLFLGALLGGATLRELRECLMTAEAELKGGISPRVAPFADKQQIGALMSRAGFALPVVDSETVTVTYATLPKLLHDLRFMGEGNAIAARSRTFTSRALWAETARLYAARFAEPDGRLTATFEIIFAIGWAPHASQPQPLKRGSATMSLATALGDI